MRRAPRPLLAFVWEVAQAFGVGLLCAALAAGGVWLMLCSAVMGCRDITP